MYTLQILPELWGKTCVGGRVPLKVQDVWDMTPCWFVNSYRCFGEAC